MQNKSINLEIFRSYDIRGIYKEDMDAWLMPYLAHEFIELLCRKYGVTRDALTIIVGRDVRHGSAPLAEAFIKGAVKDGATVIDAGLVSTDMIYFAVGHFKYDAGVMFTASHNPREYAGVKFVGQGVEGIDGETGVYEMRDKIVNYELRITNYELKIEKQGRIIRKDILDDFARHVISFVDPKKIKPLKVVVDAGNGMAIVFWDKVASFLPIKTIHLNFNLDSDFSGRGPDPSQPKSLLSLEETIIKEGADIGFAFDGDADRIYVVDNNGKRVNGSILIAAVSEAILRVQPSATILFNVTGGRIISETIAKYKDARGIITPVGHAKIKRLAKTYDAYFAGEAQSGHFFFKRNFYADSAVIFAVTLLELISKVPYTSLDAFLAPYKKYVWSGEINFPLKDNSQKQEALARLTQKYGNAGKLLTIDGIRVDFDDWWFSVRPSNTEPLLRLNVEAVSDGLLEEKKKEINEFLISN